MSRPAESRRSPRTARVPDTAETRGSAGTAEAARCRELLPSVSRTFALTIRVLPRGVRHPVTIAYLLCRLADILEDATGLDPDLRIAGLEALAGAAARPRGRPEEMDTRLAVLDRLPFSDPDALRLVRERLTVLRAWRALPEESRAVVGHWVEAMALGMAGFVARERSGPRMRQSGDPGDTAVTSERVPFRLQTCEELRTYAYYVAGTVGNLLTELFSLHLGTGAVTPRQRELAVPFGLGLQFTNILQDLAEDRRRGWSYVPEDLARRHGTSVACLDDPGSRRAALEVVGDLVGEAARYLDQALKYSLLIPRREPRIRLFCLWPTFFAVRTLVRLWGEERVLAGGEKVRITRGEVRRVVGATAAACLSNRAVAGLYALERRRLLRRIALLPV